MADKKITDLDAIAALADADLVEVVDDVVGTPTSKKSTWITIKTFLKTYFDTLYADLGANSDITSLSGLTTPLSRAQGGSGTTGDSIVKGWIQFNGTGTIAIQDSFNVSSIVDNATGDHNVVWDVNFTNDDYSCTASADAWHVRLSSIGVGSLRIRTADSTHTFTDIDGIMLQAIGDQ